MKNLKDTLIKHNVIKDVFDYEGFDKNIWTKYAYVDKKFDNLYKGYAESFKFKDCLFYIKNKLSCNAFATRIKGYNIIGITNAYAITIQDLFHEKYFKSILLVGLVNNKKISDAFCDLEINPHFKFHEFMQNCSMQYTFGHEFRHIRQFNSIKKSGNFSFNENMESSSFSMRKHAWEFDADRSAVFQVIKYVFEFRRKLKSNDDEIFKCLLYLGISSVILTKLLFYFNLVPSSNTQIKQVPFYTRDKSHPHSLVRIFNILEFFYETIKDSFPNVKIEFQDLLNNSLYTTKIYLNSLKPKQNLMDVLFDEMGKHMDAINQYNGEIFDYAIQDEAIFNLLKESGTKIIK